MARVTVDDCLEKVDNRFQLVHLAAMRVRQLRKGAASYSARNNKDIVLSLREIATGDISVNNIADHEPKARREDDFFEEFESMETLLLEETA